VLTESIVLHMGPQHPSTHGVLEVLLELDGEVIKSVDVGLGHLHRGFEKLAENREYQHVFTLCDRSDYVSAMISEMGFALAIEQMLEIEVPQRAQAIRVAVSELQRIASHIVWFGPFGLDMGAITPFLFAFRDREIVIDLFEELTGARMTYNYMRVGGVSRDLPDGWVERVLDFVRVFPSHVDDYETLLTGNEIARARMVGIGHLPVSMAMNHGATGSTLRGSGVSWDLRKDAPYSGYEKYDFDVPVGTVGDVYDRYLCRVREMRESTKIIGQALEGLPAGPVMADVPKTIKPPPGEVFSLTESPRGQLGYYVISDGSSHPYRVKMRAPSFSNLSLLPDLLPGWRIADIVMIMASIDIIMGEIDR
jgi:NADH-quinone oxidoreductase subunit D